MTYVPLRHFLPADAGALPMAARPLASAHPAYAVNRRALRFGSRAVTR